MTVISVGGIGSTKFLRPWQY